MDRRQFPALYRVMVAAGTLLVLVGLITSMTWGRRAIVKETDRQLAGNANKERVALQDYFGRAEVVAQLLARNPALAAMYESGADNLAPSVRASANDTLAYLEQLYPGSINEVCLIGVNGAEAARVVRTTVALPSQLSSDESGNPFFRPTVWRQPGQVFQASPYLSPDTGEWVISNSTLLPTIGTSSPAMLHFEVTLESFRVAATRSVSGSEGRVWVLDEAGGIVFDSTVPVGDSFVVGQDRQFARLAGVSHASTSLNGFRVAVESLTVGPHNQNHWSVVVGVNRPLHWYSGFGAVSVALLGLGLVLMIVSGLANRDHRRRIHESLTDDLTGLGNRRLLLAGLADKLASGIAQSRHTGLLLIDLDGFKEVNDTFGHHRGDALLRLVADRLAASMRPGDVVARLGGDEFAVLVTDVARQDDVSKVARRVLGALEAPFVVDGVPIVVGASIGGVLAPDHGTEAAQLVQRADVAMYDAKRLRSGIEMYVPARDPYSPDRLALANELRTAIGSGELAVHFQPICDGASGRWVGVEALIRWPGRKVSPVTMIEIAESVGLMRSLTDFVLEASLRQLRQWRDEGLDVHVAVNLSAANLVEADLTPRVARALASAGVPATSLHLELTETAAIADHGGARDALESLRRLGITLCIDDYGTGNASVAYVRGLPVHILKIDRSFVSGMFSSLTDAAIVRTTIDLAHGLGFAVVAEGVETDQELAELRRLGCDMVQGYLFSRPLSAEDLTPLLHLHAGRVVVTAVSMAAD